MPLLGEKNYRILNHSVPRKDGFEKVTGQALYAADIYLPGMIYAGVLRSPYASAQVVSIDTEAALKIPGVRAVVTASDLPKCKSWSNYMYLTERVRYVGDCVAMVAADTKELVDEAIAKIRVDYKELPAVFTIEEALSKESPRVHEEYPDNIFTESVYHIRKGKIEQGFTEADVILEREYRTQYVEHAYMEPEAVVAFYQANEGKITVHASAQNPFFTRRYVADILQIPLNQVHLIQDVLGGSFGGKEEAVGLVAARAAFLSRLTHKAVKMVFKREDSLLESAKRHPFILRYKIGAKKDGRIVAFEGTQIDNSGAYNNQTQFMNWRANVHSTGPYEIPNIKTDTYGVFTNNIHSGAMRGYSSPSLIFAQEQLIDELAEALHMKEEDLRRLNCLKDGSSTATSDTVQHVILQELMDYTLRQTEYRIKRDRYMKQDPDSDHKKGIGMAIIHRGCGFGGESPDAAGCFFIVNEDGSATINSGLAENGQGLKTAYVQIAAEASGLNYESINFYGVDSHAIPDCGMTVASRGTTMGAQSVKLAGQDMKKLLIHHAYDMKLLSLRKIEEELQLPHCSLVYQDFSEEDIDLANSQFYFKQYPSVRYDIKDVTVPCLWAGRRLSVYRWFTPDDMPQNHETGQGKAFPTFSYGCVVAEVDVDMKTGYVQVEKVTSSHDVGTAINPALIQGQVFGGIVMGQGYGVLEEVTLDRGQVNTKNLDSYLIPTTMDMPEMNVNIFECDDPSGTFGAKSVGEPATEGVAAAIANAIYSATGRRIRENPCDLESVLLGRKLRKAKK